MYSKFECIERINNQFTLKYTDKRFLQNKIFFRPTDPTLFGMGRWRGNKHYFQSGLIDIWFASLYL